MARPSRFHCPSDPLTLVSLLRRNRLAAWSASGLALAAHEATCQLRGSTQEQAVPKPLTTHFVKRAPRLTKPLELKKRPRPKRREVQRKMVAVQARVSRDRTAVGFEPARAARALARPSARLGRPVAFEAGALEPQVVAQGIQGSKESEHTLDMALEMMDIEALDTGRYRALVVQDPSDRRSIRGFLHLAYAYPAGVTVKPGGEWLYVGYPKAICRLAQFMDANTNVRTDFQGLLTFESSEMLGLPWIYLGPNDLQDYRLSRGEAEALGTCLSSGAFVFGDYSMPVAQGGAWLYVQQYPALLTIIEDALAAKALRRGEDWELEYLPSRHPILHCYYDFDAPPPGYDTRHRSYGSGFISQPWRVILHEGRTLALIGGHFYAAAWLAFGVAPSYESLDPTREFQFGVNSIIFALTQEGSITNQVMDAVRY